MKRFQEFTENVDRVAALKAKQRAAVDSLSLVINLHLNKHPKEKFIREMLKPRT